jgi:four helix bundle protein
LTSSRSALALLSQRLETRRAIGQLIRASSSVAANYRAACRGKSRADFIAKLGTVEEEAEADESGFWLEMLRAVFSLRNPALDVRTSDELERLRNEADQLVAIVVTSKKTARDHGSRSIANVEGRTSN